MIAVAKHITFNTYINNYDPTRTTTLRNAFASACKRHFNTFTKNVRDAIDKEDCFGLKIQTNVELPGGKFVFATSEEKVNKFMSWVKEQSDNDILEIKDFNQVGTGINAQWTNKYVNDSYKRGVLRSRYELKKAGYSVPSIEETGGIDISMSTPFHLDRLGLMYSRVYSELQGITAIMDQQISRVLTQGIADGDGARLLARKLVAVINGTGVGELGITDTLGRFIPARRRAEIMARTELIRAHHQAMVQEYRNWALEGVKVKAEWTTAGDARVCDVCSAMEGSIYTLDQIQNMIPAHPQCRCIALPKPIKEEIGEEDPVADMFIDKKDGIEYLKYRKRFDKAFDELSDEEKKLLINLKKVSLDPSRTPLSLDEIKEVKHMLYVVQGDLGDGMTVWRDNLMRWKVTTQGTGAMKLKYMAKILEKDIPDLLFNKNSIESMSRLERSIALEGTDVYKNGYIQWRAFNQAYMNAVGMSDKVMLYRGMSETEMSMNIYNSWKTGSMRRTLFPLNDVSVVGYSSDYDIAEQFGTSRNENDFNMMIKLIFRQSVERKNIVFPSALFDQLSRGRFVEEKEWLILGRKMKWNVKDMVLKIKDMKKGTWQTITEF